MWMHYFSEPCTNFNRCSNIDILLINILNSWKLLFTKYFQANDYVRIKIVNILIGYKISLNLDAQRFDCFWIKNQ